MSTDRIAFAKGLVQLPRCFLVGLVKAYRLLLSPWLGASCRFEPTCSVYAIAALEQHGALAGTYLTLRRLVRCQPWCEGGHDPVPASTLFTRLVTPVTSLTSKKNPS
jgi:putative membrane protein insertion efficiency factor